MISVLIPVYKIDVLELAETLSGQFKKAGIQYEIIIIDDGSGEDYLNKNKNLHQLENVSYSIREINKGRIVTRTELAARARFPWLLFIDADSSISNNSFIHTYLERIGDGLDVIIGGTVYTAEKPVQCNQRLHWKYASERVSILKRDKSSPYTGFLFNNILMRKELFRQLSFNESLEGYGHEDTWVGMQLEKLQSKVLYLNNPVMHPELDDNMRFLKKSIQALYNVKVISRSVPEDVARRHIKIYRYYAFMRKLGVMKVFNLITDVLKSMIMKNLNGCNPSLKVFDIFRLRELDRIMRNGK